MKSKANFRMIDVGQKRVTRRRAIACGTITVGRVAFKKIRDKSLPKGDVLALAEIAGIFSAKKTHELIPMCHSLPIDEVIIHCVPAPPAAVTVYAQVTAHAKTGVEMEAVMAVQGALATIWDLTKGTEPNLTIHGVRLLMKEGGKSGLWLNPDGIPRFIAAQLPSQKTLKGLRAAVAVMSDRASRGVYRDASGPVIKRALAEKGARVSAVRVLPDEPEKLIAYLKRCAADLIVISGGTGLGPRDITPETLEKFCDRMAGNLGELVRQDGAQVTSRAWLSRATAGVYKGALIVALPGNPKAAAEGMEALLPILPHALAMIKGGNHA